MTQEDLNEFTITIPYSLDDVEYVYNKLQDRYRKVEIMREIFNYLHNNNISVRYFINHYPCYLKK